MKKPDGLSLSVLLIFASLFCLRCDTNVWEFTAPSASEMGVIERGRRLMNQGKYDQAAQNFADAKTRNPMSSEARYYHSKATLYGANFNLLTIGSTLLSDFTQNNLPFSQIPLDTANLLYQVNQIIVEDLDPIIHHQTTGRFSSRDVYLDYTIAMLITGLLTIRDTDGNGIIDTNDIPAQFFLDADGRIRVVSLQGFAGKPNLLNHTIDQVTGILRGTDTLISGIVSQIIRTGYDLATLQQSVNDITESIVQYHVNTGTTANPGIGDDDGDGLTDEECLDGIDNDGDGLVDEDATVIGCP